MSDPDIIILQKLLETEGTFTSGNDLAKELGISRVGVWARLEKLREQGFEFEAIRHKGYRILAKPRALHANLIRSHLQQLGSDARLIYFAEIDSTNSEAERQLADGREAPFVVLAGSQTKGRGRLGRKWHSPDAGNAYMSFVFRPDLPPAKMQMFTLWMGLSLCRAIAAFTQKQIGIKWPNDLILNGRKLGGMLTEARVDADHTRDLVFGVGLNINSKVSEWPEEVARVATSLAHETGKEIELNLLVARIIDSGLRAYKVFCDGEYLDELHEYWKRYDILKDQPIVAHINNQRVEGIARGIDDGGTLLLEDAKGKLHSLRAGEVSLGTDKTLTALRGEAQ